MKPGSLDQKVVTIIVNCRKKREEFWIVVNGEAEKFERTVKLGKLYTIDVYGYSDDKDERSHRVFIPKNGMVAHLTNSVLESENDLMKDIDSWSDLAELWGVPEKVVEVIAWTKAKKLASMVHFKERHQNQGKVLRIADQA